MAFSSISIRFALGKLDKGGHFAAWEQPELFTLELRTAFKSLRVKNTTVLSR